MASNGCGSDCDCDGDSDHECYCLTVMDGHTSSIKPASLDGGSIGGEVVEETVPPPGDAVGGRQCPGPLRLVEQIRQPQHLAVVVRAWTDGGEGQRVVGQYAWSNLQSKVLHQLCNYGRMPLGGWGRKPVRKLSESM
jgi:hypothetical protein